MTCQHCQTWILDDDYRCRRCGRRVRSTPARISPASFPIAATATAQAYDLESEPATRADGLLEEPAEAQQRPLFEKQAFGTDSRVIPFDSLTTAAGRQSIRARAAELYRPLPLKTETVQQRHARSTKPRSTDQRRLEFQGEDQMVAQPRTDLIGDAPVAPVMLRLEATAIDALIIAIPCCLALALFWLVGGELSSDKHTLPFLLMAIATIPIFYKLLWTVAGSDSYGMQKVGLSLVDFDGNPPSQARRYQRLVGSLLSLLAAGIGLIWSLVDEDRLTWHDHISSTFPTFLGGE